MRRRFNQGEKNALWLASDGKCELCGKSLKDGWHADHVYPYSRGGDTNVRNGQALCPECNTKKGNTVMRLPAWPLELRTWQIRAFDKFTHTNKPSFLAVATPGAGKTKFALYVAHSLLNDHLVDQIVVVCPTEALKKQWADAADEVFINLNPKYVSGKFITPPFHGICVTYAQVGMQINTHLFSKLIHDEKTLVILDEPHHCGETRGWGDGVKVAFADAAYRLLITGTPYRSDSNPIPFVDYENGEGKADHTYGYKEALRDGVCRYVMFPTYEGEMEWITGASGEKRSANFATQLNEREAAERLNTAIAADGDWIRQVLVDAHTRLVEMRNNGHPDAGGLIVTKDKRHAELMGRAVKRITGTEPVLVTSDTIEAELVIEQFSKSTAYWVIAIKMVSEGVDIPRLRIGIYATNVTTELFFRQFVGRFVRVIRDLEEQVACVYLPDDPEIVASAFSIADERNHQLLESPVLDVEHDDEYEDPRDGATQQIPSLFIPIRSEAMQSGAILDEDRVSAQEIERAISIARQTNMPYVQPEVLANFARLVLEQHQDSVPTPAAPLSIPKPTRMYKQMKHLKDEINFMVKRYAAINHAEVGDVHYDWITRFGGRPHSDDDFADLQRKREWIADLLKGLLE